MLLWLVLAIMTAVVVGLLLHPLMATAGRPPATPGGSSAVYRDQLAEIDAEANRGLIGPNEADAARREIARRLIASEAQLAGQSATPTAGNVGSGGANGRTARMALPAVAMIGVLVPLVALAIYLQTGAPGLPAQPIAARRVAPPANPEIAKLVTAVEARLKDNPEDGRGWDAIAPAYLRLSRFAEAANAYAQASRLLGETAPRMAGLAESLMFAAGGRVGPDARVALTKLLALEPGHVQARFWLAFAKEQDGDLKAAAADYAKLLAEAPPDASWRSMVEEQLREVRSAESGGEAGSDKAQAGSGLPGLPQVGPTAADVAAAERLSPTDRKAMIDDMVSGLAARLEKDGRDLAGWERLIRALTVLGRADEARAALGRARKSLADEPQALTALADLAKNLGLGT